MSSQHRDRSQEETRAAPDSTIDFFEGSESLIFVWKE